MSKVTYFMLTIKHFPSMDFYKFHIFVSILDESGNWLWVCDFLSINYKLVFQTRIKWGLSLFDLIPYWIQYVFIKIQIYKPKHNNTWSFEYESVSRPVGLVCYSRKRKKNHFWEIPRKWESSMGWTGWGRAGWGLSCQEGCRSTPSHQKKEEVNCTDVIPDQVKN